MTSVIVVHPDGERQVWKDPRPLIQLTDQYGWNGRMSDVQREDILAERRGEGMMSYPL